MRFFRRPESTVLLVCTANICRSPMAEALMREELKKRSLHKRVKVDSAGTHATQVGHRPDARAQKVCARQGINLSDGRARQLEDEDFHRFDFILAMDEPNHRWLLEHCPEPYRKRISRLADWACDKAADIPDPYYGNLAGFERVFVLLQDPIANFVDHLMGELTDQ